MIAFLQSTYTGMENSWSNLFGILGQLFFLIFVFAAVVILAVYCTRWIAGSGSIPYLKKGPSHIKVIERAGVAPGASVQILQVGETYLLIGITKDKISFLTEVDKHEILHDVSQ